MTQPTYSKRIGLIGGLALRAGIFYYEQLALRYNEQKKPLDLVLQHADVSTVLASIAANDRAGLGRYLGRLANNLFDAGAAIVAITAVAPHLAFKEVTQTARGQVANVLEAIPAGLRAASFQRVAVFGNRAVMESNVFGAIPADFIVRLEPSLIDDIHTIYGEIALRGKRGAKAETEHLSQVARELIDKRGAQAIVLAGTDLSSFYAEHKPDYPYLDVAQLHLDQLIGNC
jgi:aspartate/glutamate racemase